MTQPTPPSKPAPAARSSSATASRPSGGTATAARPTASTNGSTAASFTGVQAALQSVDQLKYTVDQLQHELQGYADPNVVGRDTILLKSFFDQAVGRIMQISLACKIPWTPPQNTAARGR